jgi:hypothetical protein
MTEMARLYCVSLLVLVLLIWEHSYAIDPAAYWAERGAFINAEQNLYLGAKQKLNPEEERANAILMAAKWAEFDQCFDVACFPPSRHFFLAKPDIEASEVFNIIKRMPKGTNCKYVTVSLCVIFY